MVAHTKHIYYHDEKLIDVSLSFCSQLRLVPAAMQESLLLFISAKDHSQI